MNGTLLGPRRTIDATGWDKGGGALRLLGLRASGKVLKRKRL